MPSIDLYEDSPANKVNIADFCANKKIVLFAVPGAFTPGCSKVSFTVFGVFFFYFFLFQSIQIEEFRKIELILKFL